MEKGNGRRNELKDRLTLRKKNINEFHELYELKKEKNINEFHEYKKGIDE
jgi:hypothetical protein